MKNNSFLKRHTDRLANRFICLALAVMLFAALTVGIISGVQNIGITTEKYYNDYSAWDINVKSTLGFTREDVEAIAQKDYVDGICGAVSFDVPALLNFDKEFDIRIYSVEFDTDFIGGKNNMLSVNLVDGSYPMNDQSCIAVLPHNSDLGVKIGDIIYLRQGGNILNQLAFTVTGLAESPEFVAKDNENAFAIYIPIAVYTQPAVYTDIFLSLKGHEDVGMLSDDYGDYLNNVATDIEAISGEREQARVEQLIGQQQANKNEIEQDYKDFTSGLNSYLSARKKELDAMKKKIEETEKELSERKALLAQTKQELEVFAADVEALREKPEEELTDQDKEIIKQYDSDLLKYELDMKKAAEDEGNLNAEKTRYQDAEKVYKQDKDRISNQIKNEKDKFENYDFGENAEYNQVWTVSSRSDVKSFKSVQSTISSLRRNGTVILIVLVPIFLAAVYVITKGVLLKCSKQTAVYMSLGYDGKSIAAKFTRCAAWYTFLGAALGALIGVFIMPRLIFNIIDVSLSLPEITFDVPYMFVLLTVATCVIISAITVYFVGSKLAKRDISDMYISKPAGMYLKKIKTFLSKIKEKYFNK